MKKYAPYILIILIALVGLFGPTGKVSAQLLNNCYDVNGNIVTPDPTLGCLPPNSTTPPAGGGGSTAGTCSNPLFTIETSCTQNGGTWTPAGGGGVGGVNGTCYADYDTKNLGVDKHVHVAIGRSTDNACSTILVPRYCSQQSGVTTPVTNCKSSWVAESLSDSQAALDPTKSAFEKEITDNNKCSVSPVGEGSFYPGCFIQLFYGLFYVIPSYILWACAYFFNVLISVTLYSTLFTKSFVGDAWGVVRDLSNIFFILILLYIAVKIILDIGGHEAKQMIAKVLIIALLINFSMFFTNIIIDASNILALIFYNKMQVDTKNADGSTRPYQATASGEKDVAGGMVAAFNPTTLIGQDFLTKAKIQILPNGEEKPAAPGDKISPGILIGMLLIAGLLMFFAAYCLFVAGLSFLSRMIELFVLIIFSPFAFMSSTIPILSSVEYLGWDAWFKRLLKTAFMAPIFMFFLYFIFLLIQSKIFTGLIEGNKARLIESILMIVLPALLILILLLKATEFAKKGSGKLGEVMMTGAKMVGGLALGAATGGVAALAVGTIGRGAAAIANNDETRRLAAGGEGISSKDQARAQRRLALANSFAKNSYDVRQTGLGKFAAKQTGMDFSKGTGIIGLDTERFKGGRTAQVKAKAEKELEKEETYNMSGDAAKKQNDRNAQYEADKGKQKFIDKKDEERFKKAYEEGDPSVLSSYGITKKVETGSVKNAAGINADRRMAYANSLQAKAEKDEARGAFKTFFSEFATGMKKMTTTPGGLATTAAVGVATGGLGAGVAVVGGGFLHALRETVMPAVRATNSEVIAAIRKGQDPNKKLIAELKKMTEKGHGDSGKLSHIAEGMTGGDKHTPAQAEAPAVHTTSSGSAPAADHSHKP